MWKADSLEKTLLLVKIEGNRRRGQQRMRWLESITYSMNMNFSKLQEIVENSGAWSATVHGVSKSQQQQQTFFKGSNNVLTKSSLVDLFHQTQEVKQEKPKRNSKRQEWDKTSWQPSLKTIKPEPRHGPRLLGGRSPEIKINTFKNSNAQKITLKDLEVMEGL